MCVRAPFIHSLKGRGIMMDNDLEAGVVEQVEVCVGDVASNGEDRISIDIEASHLMRGMVSSGHQTGQV